MQIQRAVQYAVCTSILEIDPDVPGEALFDQALSNGLAALVAHQWPGREANVNGRTFSADTLLKIIEENTPQQPDGTHIVSWQRHDGTPAEIVINVGALRNGITETQAVRHARGPGALTRTHVEALLALDAHPALRRVSEVQSDKHWADAGPADAAEQDRALAYLSFIGDDEAAERAERASDHLEPYHPKHNPDGNRSTMDHCPVCGYEAFRLEAPDGDGYGTGVGACFVCSYTRTPEVSYFLTLSADYEATFPHE